MAEALIFEAHGVLLRALCSATNTHYEGLAVAARRSKLSSPLKKKLVHFDFAFNLVRHITRPSVDLCVSDVRESLSFENKPEVEHTLAATTLPAPSTLPTRTLLPLQETTAPLASARTPLASPRTLQQKTEASETSSTLTEKEATAFAAKRKGSANATPTLTATPPSTGALLEKKEASDKDPLRAPLLGPLLSPSATKTLPARGEGFAGAGKTPRQRRGGARGPDGTGPAPLARAATRRHLLCLC